MGSEMSCYRVLIPDGESSFSGGVVRGLAADSCFRSQVLARTHWAPVRLSRYCERFGLSQRSFPDVEQIVARARAWSADVLLPVDEPSIRGTIVARDALRAVIHLPPLPSLEAFDLAGDKWELARQLVESQLPHPPTALLANDPYAALDKIAFPALLKPRRGSNGIGIRRFERREDLEAELDRDLSYATDCILQSYVPGTDIDCSVLCVDGEIVASTVQRPIHAGNSSFRPSGAIEFIEEERVVGIAERLMKALNWSGVAHLDMRIDTDSGELLVIEVNPRYWGSLLGSLYAGVNFAALACRLALGLPLPAARQMPCQYLSGTAVFRSLFRPSGRRHREPVVRRTALGHILGDPGPELVEVLGRIMPRLAWGIGK